MIGGFGLHPNSVIHTRSSSGLHWLAYTSEPKKRPWLRQLVLNAMGIGKGGKPMLG
jgi:hypothetical protein